MDQEGQLSITHRVEDQDSDSVIRKIINVSMMEEKIEVVSDKMAHK
jgi:hypothetical protein